MSLSEAQGRVTWSVLPEAWEHIRSRHVFWALACSLILSLNMGVGMLSALGFRSFVGHSPGEFLMEMYRFEAALGHLALILLGALIYPFHYSAIFLGLRSLRGERVALECLLDLRGVYWKLVLFTLALNATYKLIPAETWWLSWLIWILVWPLTDMAALVLLDGRGTLSDFLVVAWSAVYRQYWLIVLLSFVATLFAMLGLAALLIGVLFTAPMFLLAPAAIYRRIFDPPDMPPLHKEA